MSHGNGVRLKAAPTSIGTKEMVKRELARGATELHIVKGAVNAVAVTARQMQELNLSRRKLAIADITLIRTDLFHAFQFLILLLLLCSILFDPLIDSNLDNVICS
jgi:hypothetical protein